MRQTGGECQTAFGHSSGAMTGTAWACSSDLSPYRASAGTDRLPGRTRVSVRQAAYAISINLPDYETRPIQKKWCKEELQRLEAKSYLLLIRLHFFPDGHQNQFVRLVSDCKKASERNLKHRRVMRNQCTIIQSEHPMRGAYFKIFGYWWSVRGS